MYVRNLRLSVVSVDAVDIGRHGGMLVFVLDQIRMGHAAERPRAQAPHPLPAFVVMGLCVVSEPSAQYDQSLDYYAASVAGHGEFRAAEWLRQGGFSVLIPSRTVVTRRAIGGRHVVRRPIFPGYVFVGKDAQQSWRDILRVPGVRSLITTGEAPTVLPQWMLKTLAAADQMGAYDKPRSSFAPGHKVRIVDDLWNGLIGEVMRAPEGRRIFVLLNAFGRKHQLSIDVDRLIAA